MTNFQQVAVECFEEATQPFTKTLHKDGQEWL